MKASAMKDAIGIALGMLIAGLGVGSAAGVVTRLTEQNKTSEKAFALNMAATEAEDGDGTVSVAELLSAQAVPKQARRLYLKGLKADQRGREQEALSQIQAAIELAPDYFQAHAALAVGYLKVNQSDEAEHEVGIALKLDPHYLAGREIQALVWFFEGRVRESAVALADLAKQTPNRVLVQYYLGRALVRLGDLQEAEYHFQQAHAIVRKAQPQRQSDMQPWDTGAWSAPPGFRRSLPPFLNPDSGSWH